MVESSARPKQQITVDNTTYDSFKDAVEGVAHAYANIKTISGTSYTLTDEDHGLTLDFTSASAVTVTIPQNLRKGFTAGISQGAAGQVTINAASGVTRVEADGRFKTEKQYALVTVAQFAPDTYRLFGRTAA